MTTLVVTVEVDIRQNDTYDVSTLIQNQGGTVLSASSKWLGVVAPGLDSRSIMLLTFTIRDCNMGELKSMFILMGLKFSTIMTSGQPDVVGNGLTIGPIGITDA